MVRSARKDTPGSWHHVVNRGIAPVPRADQGRAGDERVAVGPTRQSCRRKQRACRQRKWNKSSRYPVRYLIRPVSRSSASVDRLPRYHEVQRSSASSRRVANAVASYSNVLPVIDSRIWWNNSVKTDLNTWKSGTEIISGNPSSVDSWVKLKRQWDDIQMMSGSKSSKE